MFSTSRLDVISGEEALFLQHEFVFELSLATSAIAVAATVLHPAYVVSSIWMCVSYELYTQCVCVWHALYVHYMHYVRHVLRAQCTHHVTACIVSTVTRRTSRVSPIAHATAMFPGSLNLGQARRPNQANRDRITERLQKGIVTIALDMHRERSFLSHTPLILDTWSRIPCIAPIMQLRTWVGAGRLHRKEGECIASPFIHLHSALA